jgi:hypothetical protein
LSRKSWQLFKFYSNKNWSDSLNRPRPTNYRRSHEQPCEHFAKLSSVKCGELPVELNEASFERHEFIQSLSRQKRVQRGRDRLH